MSYYRFTKLKMYGFMSYENAELNLEDNGYVLISGINNDKRDCAKSNGSGKSSLISDSILWALTGETSRGAKQVANNVLDDGVFVELEFFVDKDKYKIIRSRNHKELGTNLKIYINNEDKSGKGIRDGEELLKKYLPDLTPLLISSVMILGQGLPSKFTNNTPSGRKELLEKLSKSDFMIEDIKNKLSARKNELNNNVRKSEDEMLTIKTKLSIKEDEKEQAIKELDKYESITYTEEEIEQNIIENQNKLTLIKDNIKNTEKQITEEREKYLTIDNNLKDYIIQKNQEYNESVKKIIEDILNLNATINSLNKEIQKQKSIKDICPVCGQKIVGVHKIDTTDKENEVEQLTEKKKELTDLQNKQKELSNTEIEKYKQEQEKIKAKIKQNGESLKEELKEQQQRKNDLTNGINSDTIILQELKVSNERKKTQENKIKTLEIEIKQLKEQREICNRDKELQEKHLEIVSKMTTFATRDFRGILLSNIIEFINKKMKEYLISVSNNDDINFELSGNNIEITYNNKSYELLSGGEKQKIDLIIQFSIRDMLNQYLNFNTNILVLDEVMDFLDETNCRNIITLIENYCKDIESVYFITHHTELNFPYDKEIVVVKDENGISRTV